MNREDAFNFDPPPRQNHEPSGDFGPRDGDADWARRAGREPAAFGGAASPATGMWDFLELLSHRWGWLFLGGLVLAAGAGAGGLRLWQTRYTVMAQLVYY